MSLDAAMRAACAEIEIEPPKSVRLGRWLRTPVAGKSRSNRSGAVLVFEDGRAGLAYNWTTGLNTRFTVEGSQGAGLSPEVRREAAERRARRERDEAEVAAICEQIVSACVIDHHQYLWRKGFPDSAGLVIEGARTALPDTAMGHRIATALPESSDPLLVIPGRIGRQLTTVQFITADGDKKNVLGGRMGGACHRIASGRETWVCEGIATALSVNAALRLLGRSATVLSAFSAANVGRVASGIEGAVIAADHDKPVESLGGLGAGEFYASRSGRRWVQPRELGDFNDMHMSDGLRAVAVLLREVRPA